MYLPSKRVRRVCDVAPFFKTQYIQFFLLYQLNYLKVFKFDITLRFLPALLSLYTRIKRERSSWRTIANESKNKKEKTDRRKFYKTKTQPNQNITTIYKQQHLFRRNKFRKRSCTKSNSFFVSVAQLNLKKKLFCFWYTSVWCCIRWTIGRASWRWTSGIKHLFCFFFFCFFVQISTYTYLILGERKTSDNCMFEFSIFLLKSDKKC